MRILKVVNSSLFGLTRKVADLGQALALLGVKPLKMVVLGFSLPAELFADVDQDILIQYWRHTLLKAAACRELSRRLFPARMEEAFTAGLLQDIGELVLIQQLGHTYIRFRRQVNNELRPLREAEWLALGFDHVELSARLLRQWGMPESISTVVAAKGPLPEEDANGQRALTQTLHIAELMARVLESANRTGLSGLLAAAHDELRLKAEQVEEILTDLAQRAAELATILNLELPASSLEISSAAHARLAETSVEVLEDLGEAALLSDMTTLQNEMQAAIRKKLSAGAFTPVATHGPVERSTDGAPTERGGELSSPPPRETPLVTSAQFAQVVSLGISRCRSQQSSLTLVLFQAHEHNEQREAASAPPSPERLKKALQRWSQQRGSVLAVKPGSFACLWEGCRRNEGFELARHMLDQARESDMESQGILPPGWMLTAGLATLTLPPRNFPPRELISAAERCLSGAILSGGNAVKSIEF
jgi:HD-like signal output (HDOD) protein